MRRQAPRRTLGALLGAGVTIVMLAGPAVADPPPSSGSVDRFVVTDGFGILADFQNGYWVFANITREGFCDWLAGGEVGPPPALEPNSVQVVDTGSAVVTLFKSGVVPTALHAMTGPDHPCDGSDPEPWATGEASVVINDNDADVSGTRTNSFGEHGHGTVFEVATGDAWHYSWHIRLQITRDGEFRIVNEVFRLKKRGN
ncbi:MAG TPA: hypothetical protein VF129_09705 [Actinomycetota bacterium]